MAKEVIDLRNELKNLRTELDLIQKIDCSNADNKLYRKMKKEGKELPTGIYEYKNQTGEPLDIFYKLYETDLTFEEKTEYLMLKKICFIKTIKNCVLFFTILTIIGMIIAFLISGSL